MIKKPFVIALDGINGVGKSTVASFISTHLGIAGISTHVVRLPGARQLESTKAIRKILDEYGADMSDLSRGLLYLADFAEYCKKVIEGNALHTDIIITDRSFLSTLVYQGKMEGVLAPLIPMFLEAIGPAIYPDMLFLLYNSNYEEAINRIQNTPGEKAGSIAGYSSKNKEWYAQLNTEYQEEFLNPVFATCNKTAHDVHPFNSPEDVALTLLRNHILPTLKEKGLLEC